MQDRAPTIARGQRPVPLTLLLSWQHSHMHGEAPHGITSFTMWWRHPVRHPAPAPNDASAPLGVGGVASRRVRVRRMVGAVGQDSPGPDCDSTRRSRPFFTLNYQTAHLCPVSQSLTCHSKSKIPISKPERKALSISYEILLYIDIDSPRNSLVAALLTFRLRIFQLYNWRCDLEG